MSHLLSFRVDNLLWFQDTMFFIGALGGVFGLVMFGHVGTRLWRIALKQRHCPAFVLSCSFWMIAIGSISFTTEEVLERFSWIKYSIVSPVVAQVFRFGFSFAVVLLVIGFSMGTFMKGRPNKKP